MAHKILVVEDEPILGLELREDLLASGFDVPEVVQDGDQVMSAVILHKPELIVMDIKLFGYRDGIEAAQRFRPFFEIPVIFLSSYPLEEVESRIKKLNNTIYLEKPYQEQRLVDAINNLLDGRKLA